MRTPVALFAVAAALLVLVAGGLVAAPPRRAGSSDPPLPTVDPHRSPMPGATFPAAALRRSESADDGGPGPSSAAPRPAADLTLSGTTVLNLSHSMTIGNLSVSGSAQLDFGNRSWSATLTIEGDVYLSGSAQLDVWDAYLVVAGSYTGSRSIYLTNDSRWTLNDVLVTSNGFTFDTYANGSANVTARSTSLGDWTVVSLEGSSSFYGVNSAVYADLQPTDSSRLVLVGSADPTIWLIFPDDSAGRVSVPPANEETNWSFPRSGTTAGIGYSIRLAGSWPRLFAVLVNDAANVTIANSTGVDVSLLPVGLAVEATGLAQTEYADFTFPSASLGLRLLNTSVESWSFYAVSSTLALSESQLGEVMGWTNSSVTLTDANLTGSGGLYAAYEATHYAIVDSRVASQVLAADDTFVTVANSSVVDPGNASLLAVDDARLDLVNDSIAGGVGLQVQGNGTLEVLEPLTVAVTTLYGELSPDAARVSAAYAANGTSVAPAETAAGGNATFLVPVTLLDSGGTTGFGPINVTAVLGDLGGEAAGRVTAPATWPVVLVPLLASTDPTNGSTGVNRTAPVTLDFGLPMVPVPTGTAITVAPALPFSLAWAAGDRSVNLSGEFAPGTTYTVSVGTGARTVLGLAWPAAESFGFSTSAAPEPVTVVRTEPAANATGVAPLAPIEFEFSVPMNGSSTIGAFSLLPASPGVAELVNGTLLRWTPSQPLALGTTFAASVGSGAESTLGRALPLPVTIRFSTPTYAEIPRVIAVDPGNGSVVGEVPNNVTLTWNVPMDPAATAAAFGIYPNNSGTVAVSGAELVWTPFPSPSTDCTVNGNCPSSNASVTIVVSTGARSAAGVAPVSTEFFTFEIEGSVSSPSSSPAPGSPAPDWELAAGVLGALSVAGWAAFVWASRRNRIPPLSSGGPLP